MIKSGASNISVVYVDDDICENCLPCDVQKLCNVKAIIRFGDDEPPYIDMHHCYGCMKCVVGCPFDAIKTA